MLSNASCLSFTIWPKITPSPRSEKGFLPRCTLAAMFRASNFWALQNKSGWFIRKCFHCATRWSEFRGQYILLTGADRADNFLPWQE